MFGYWRKRKERQQLVIRDADNLMALYGDRAYSVALARAQIDENKGGHGRHWYRVRREIARRIGKEPGLDVAT